MEPFLFFLVAGGAAAYSFAAKGRAHARWKPVLDEAARRLGGRASTATMFDAPELRAEVNGLTVTLKLQNINKAPRRVVSISEASLPEGMSGVRLYFGWDVTRLSRDLEYISEIPFPKAFGLEGRVIVRADDAVVAHHFAERVAIDLVDTRREASAHAVEVLARGGTVRLAVHGLLESAAVVERLVRATARITRSVVESARAPAAAAPKTPPTPPARPPSPLPIPEPAPPKSDSIAPPAPPPPVTPTVEAATCGLCGEARTGPGAWLRCTRCKTAYHPACWHQATGCVADGCTETRSIPF
jgi:hypothetical protein